MRIGVPLSFSFSLLSVPRLSFTTVFYFTSVCCPLSSTPSYLASALQEHISSDSPFIGLKLHTQILKVGLRLSTSIAVKLLILHSKCGHLHYARQVFEDMSHPTLFAYNYLIDAYIKNRCFNESFDLVRRMSISGERPDCFTLSLVLKAWNRNFISMCLGHDFGRQVHALIVKSSLEEDTILISTLVDAYVKCGRVNYAGRIFDKMSVENVMCSTSMISGYMEESRLEEAECIFRRLKQKDAVAFNAMIEGYSKTPETAKKSVGNYTHMRRSNIHPTISTFVSLIGACSVLASIEIGQQVQSQIMKTPYFYDLKIASALIDMYSKCGDIEEAWKIFDHMPGKNVISWTSMINGLGKNGKPKEAVELFDKMQNECRVRPNHITFLGVLSACGHSGWLRKGEEIFESMKRDYSLKPGMEHYACMVDLIGRFGGIERAWKFVREMPEKPNSNVWAALLSCCRLHGDVDIANIAANELFKFDGDSRPGAYLSLSNTLADAGRWEGVSEVRKLMKMRKVYKDTGFSY